MPRTRRFKHTVAGAGPVLTARGWTALAAGLVAAGFGIWRHEPAFVQSGLFVSGVLVAGAWAVARRNLTGVEITRQTPAAVFVGEVFPATVRVTRGGPGRARGAELTDEFLGPLGEGASIRGLGRRQTVERTVETRLRHRGVNPSFRWTLSSTFPGGLWRATRNGRDPVPIKVFPRPVWPEHLADPTAAFDETEAGVLASPRRDAGDYLGIREFAPGDPLKIIHWRATARAQRLVVREFDRELPAGYAVFFFFSFATPGALRLEDAFESALEMLTGLLLRCRECNLPLALTADFAAWRTLRLTDSHDLSEPLTLLAVARWSPSSDLAPLAEKLAEVAEDCRVFLVSDTPLRHWEHLVPDWAAEVTCLSVAEMRRRRPSLARRHRT